MYDGENGRGGGVAIYVKNGIEFNVMESLSCAVEIFFDCISIKERARRKINYCYLYIYTTR